MTPGQLREGTVIVRSCLLGRLPLRRLRATKGVHQPVQPVTDRWRRRNDRSGPDPGHSQRPGQFQVHRGGRQRSQVIRLQGGAHGHKQLFYPLPACVSQPPLKSIRDNVEGLGPRVGNIAGVPAGRWFVRIIHAAERNEHRPPGNAIAADRHELTMNRPRLAIQA